MKERLLKLIGEHKMLLSETQEQLSELNKIDISKFGKKEKLEIEESITELELERSLRQCFLSDLESVLE